MIATTGGGRADPLQSVGDRSASVAKPPGLPGGLSAVEISSIRRPPARAPRLQPRRTGRAAAAGKCEKTPPGNLEDVVTPRGQRSEKTKKPTREKRLHENAKSV